MTRAAAIAAPAAEQVRELELVRLQPSPFNPRKTPDPAGLAELAESIRQHDVQVPLLVRPIHLDSYDGDTWEIVAGGRRAAASALAGKLLAPCIVREMTDDEAREIALIDNLQREDMPALEEADAYEALRQQLGDAERIAARVGKPIEYIAKRLKLIALGELQRQALATRLITIDHALLLTRLGPIEQDANLKWCLDVNAGIKTTLAEVIADVTKRRDGKADGRWGYWECRSVLDLKHHIEQHTGRALSKAPWSLDDAELVPSAGACNGCSSNTAHNTALFADLSIEKATCEDGKCFEEKRERFVQIKLDQAKVDDGSLTKWIFAVKLSYKISEAKPPMASDGSGPNIARVLRYGQWLDVKAGSCPHVRKGVTVDWEEGRFGDSGKGKPGVTKLVCIAEGCKVHPKAYEKKAGGASTGGRDEAAENAAREKSRQAAIAENKLRVAFVGKALEGITAIPAAALRIIAHGALPGWEEARRALNSLLPGIVKIIQTYKADSPDFAKAIALASLEQGQLQCDDDGYRDDSKEDRAELIKAVRGWGYAGPDPWSEAKAAPKKAVPVKAAPKKSVPAKKAAKKAPAKKAAKAVRK